MLAQDYPAIEYIVIDGGSFDGTLDVIRRHESQISKWVSEPDKGISDGFNKGLRLASGDFFTFVNADDWLSPGQLSAAMATFAEHPEAAFVFGDLICYERGRPIFRQVGRSDYRRSIRYRMNPLNHPTLVARRYLVDRIGGFSVSYRSAMDFDWLQRVDIAGYFGVYSDQIVGNFSLGGESQSRVLRNLSEVRRATISNYHDPVGAWVRYLFSVIKIAVRLSLERSISAEFARRLRFFINRNIRPAKNDE